MFCTFFIALGKYKIHWKRWSKTFLTGILQAKKLKEETRSSSANTTPRPSTSSKDSPDLNSQLAMMSMLGFPFIPNPFMPMMPPDFFTNPLFAVQQNAAAAAAAAALPHGELAISLIRLQLVSQAIHRRAYFQLFCQRMNFSNSHELLVEGRI